MTTVRGWTLAWMALALAGGTPAWADGPRFMAVLADGRRLQGPDVMNWGEPEAQPRLADVPLFDPAGPIVLLRDESLPPARPPRAFVEFWLGDRLPGQVTSFAAGGESPHETLPPHLVVEPDEAANSRDPAQATAVRVSTRWVRRVVWQRRASEQFQPGTAWYRDGRQVRFRSLRWLDQGVRLLLDDGTSDVSFQHLAELHLPAADAWEAWYEQVAGLCPEETSRLVCVDCSDGLRATSSTDRYRPFSRGDASQPDNWRHIVEPLWSLDPLWLLHRSVRVRQWSWPHEVSLSALEVAHSERRSMLARGAAWRRDRSIQGQPLRSGGWEYTWGFGVQSALRLEFDLPPIARTFRTRVGLDEAAGRGGCAQGLVFCGKEVVAPLFASPLLIGSSQVVDSGPLALPQPASDGLRLALVADAAHDQRPTGADPFDIRDLVDWLEPQVGLDPVLLREEALRRSPRLVTAWDGWEVEDFGAGLSVASVWDTSDPSGGRYRLHVQPRERFLRLTRQVEIADGRDWLLLHASRQLGGTPARIQVEVDGQPVAAFDVPERYTQDPDPLAVPLRGYRGRDVRLGIVQAPAGERAFIDWRGLSLAGGRPSVLRLFEDEPRFVADLTEGQGQATLVKDGAFSGTGAVEITPSERYGGQLAGLPVPIREYPRLGEFRYLRFAWKKSGGERICLGLGHDGRWGADKLTESQVRRGFRYDAGTGGASHGLAWRLDSRLPTDWVVVTRDLFADFGPFTLTGLWLSAPDGEAARFDHIYLARSVQDLDRIAQDLRGEAGP